MNNDNPYRAPSAEVADVPEHGTLEPATRLQRFGAAFIDGIASSIIVLPIAFAMGMFNFSHAKMHSQPFGQQIALGIAGMLVFLLLQTYFLKKTGQTIGKRMVGIRIVDLDDQQPSLGTLLGKRYGTVFVFQLLPIIGGVLGLADILCIFRQDRRCIHDLVANTRVVVAGRKS